ncbi:MAG: amino acid permease [Kordiimonadaceae bacterium]|nr:amino acid permease [Kordiimonadaceae bacterium]
MKKSLGIWRTWALVVGTIIGSGIFTLPAILAPYGKNSFYGWGLATLGTLSIAFALSHLSSRNPREGGPYTFVEEAFGHYPAMFIAWGYWISVWVSVAAIATSFSGYTAIFFPIITDHTWLSAFVATAVVWLFTYVNVRGVEEVSIVQLVTVILKLIPLFIVGVIGFFMGDITGVPAINPNGESFPTMVSGITLLVMWSFIGIEAATVPSDNIENPKKTIPRALVLGTFTAAATYIFATAGVMALIPIEVLQNSTSPFADSTSIIFGELGSLFVGIGALVAIGGALNSNILLSGTVSMAGSFDGVFPSFFRQKNKEGTPVTALIYSSALSTAVILFNANKGLLNAFEIMILIATFSILLAYLGVSLASLKLQLKDRIAGRSVNFLNLINSFLAILYSLYAIVGAWVVY